jgi:hypothetical protein
MNRTSDLTVGQRIAAGVLIFLTMIFLITCLVVGTLGLWHLAFGWPR